MNLKANSSDNVITAGSSTTNAYALMLKILNDFNSIKSSSLTTIHSYTSDQPLLDLAKSDLKRSRSAAKNIIPNKNLSYEWIEKVIPCMKNKIFSSALNVPVQFGSLLDITTVFENSINSEEEINSVIDSAAKKHPNLITVNHDPIFHLMFQVCLGQLYLMIGTLKIGENMVKTLSWYDNGLTMQVNFDYINI